MENHTNTRSLSHMAFLSRFSPDPRTFRSCLFDYHHIYRDTWIFPGPFLNNILLLPAVCFSLLRLIKHETFQTKTLIFLQSTELPSLQPCFLNNYIYLLGMYEQKWSHMRMYAEVREQFAEVITFILPCEYCRSNSSCHAWRPAHQHLHP